MHHHPLGHAHTAATSAGKPPLPAISEWGRIATTAHPAGSITIINPPGARPVTATRPFGAVTSHRRGVSPPWESQAVMDLASRVGHGDRDATPMMIEGTTGTTLAAVGNERDHQVASAAISASLDKQLGEKLERAQLYKRELEAKASVEGGAQEGGAREGGAPRAMQPRLRMANLDDGGGGGGGTAMPTALAVRRSVAPSGGRALATADEHPGALHRTPVSRPYGSGEAMSFGAVYEYRDDFGRPRFVASTSQQPEATFAEDYGRHAEVRSLANEGGSASVVWAGVGRGPCCGAPEMQAAREAVARDRSERQRISELRGAKPYSRHGHMLTF